MLQGKEIWRHTPSPRDNLGYLLFDLKLSNSTYELEIGGELRGWLDRHGTQAAGWIGELKSPG